MLARSFTRMRSPTRATRRAASTVARACAHAALVANLLSVGGCSVLFMEKLPDDYDPRKEEPRCTASQGFAVWDAVIAGGDAAALLLVANADTQGDPKAKNAQQTFMIALAAEGVMHLVSGIMGSSWASECTLARAERDAFVDEQSKLAERRLFRPRPRPKVTPMAPPPPPRGFYCASDVCAREKSACEQLRMAAGDAEACNLVESAYCFRLAGAHACSNTLSECVRQHELAGPSAQSDCEASN